MLPGVHDQGTVGRREYLSLHVCHTLSELTAHQAESQTVNTFSELCSMNIFYSSFLSEGMVKKGIMFITDFKMSVPWFLLMSSL